RGSATIGCHQSGSHQGCLTDQGYRLPDPRSATPTALHPRASGWRPRVDKLGSHRYTVLHPRTLP
ncbi:MAG TPA: hypothetical protein PLZ16_08440, partial [Gammaproteobacteria bacterium]|nr:hypothetical protein [Gammaproteobacteria bacterium]